MNEYFKNRACPEAIDLLSKLFVYDPLTRINVGDALAHPFINIDKD